MRKAISGYEGLYVICSTGKIFSKKGLEKTPRSNGLGYLQVNLYKNGVGKNHYVHRLVAEHFLRGDSRLEVNHVDGDKSNNSSSNLEYVSRSENYKHAVSSGLIKKDRLGRWKA